MKKNSPALGLEINPVLFYGEPYLLHDDQAVMPAPRLILPEPIFRELVHYFAKTPQEMQVMGLVRRDAETNVFHVTDLMVPPHRAGYVYAELDQDAFPRWLDVLESAGKDIAALRLQAHSHGTLDAYFSEDDLDTIRNAYSCDWMISLVGNQACHFLARLDVFSPIPLSIALPILVEMLAPPSSSEEMTQWNKKLEDAASLLTWRDKLKSGVRSLTEEN